MAVLAAWSCGTGVEVGRRRGRALLAGGRARSGPSSGHGGHGRSWRWLALACFVRPVPGRGEAEEAEVGGCGGGGVAARRSGP